MLLHITSREREIINLLLLHPDGITVFEVAQKIDLSQRTIHRELKNVASILIKHEMSLEKKSGVGLFLQGSSEARNELKISLLKNISDFTSKEREELILLTLLKSTDVMKLVALANDFNVTAHTISGDLDKIASYLKSFEITLIRKKGHGISLQATEQQKRNALGYFLAMQFNEYEFLEILKDPDANNNKFLEIIKIEKLILAEKLIREMMAQYDLQLTDHAHMTLTIHLSLAIERIVQGEIITIDEALLEKIKNDDKYVISKEIAAVVEDVFNIEIPDAELGYITIHLKGARLNASILNRIDKRTSIHTVACKALISYVSQKLNVPFEKDPAVLDGLLKHFEPAVYRLERGLNLYNPLTTQIITEYPRVFEATKEGLKRCYGHIRFSDGEIAYVVLYFGASYILYDAKREARVAVICPSGLGSSSMLAHRVEKEIESVKEVITFSLGELDLLDLSDFDLVLSTVEIAEYADKYLLISPILSDLEIDRIQKEVKKHKRVTEDVLLERARQNKQRVFQFDIKEEFQKVKIYSELVLNLLEEFEINHLIMNENQLEVENAILNTLYVNKVITNICGVRNDLKERESLGGFGIPGTQMAIYHCRTAYVSKPIFRVFRLDRGVFVAAMDQTMVDVTSILVMLAPTDALVIELEVLSIISAAVVEDASAIKRFTIGSEALIEERLKDVFYQNFRMMFNK